MGVGQVDGFEVCLNRSNSLVIWFAEWEVLKVRVKLVLLPVWTEPPSSTTVRLGTLVSVGHMGRADVPGSGG